MRGLILAALCCAGTLVSPAGTLVSPAGAQQPRGEPAAARQGVPASVAREAADVYNAAETLRSMGPYAVDSGRTIDGDLAVIDGPLDVAGRVGGRIVAINADVRLHPGASVGGDVLVLGGAVSGRDSARIEGDLRIYADRLVYREVDDRIVVDEDEPRGSFDDWWARWRARQERSGPRFVVSTGKTYNRVEGLPLQAGPGFRGRYPWGAVDAEALGILRTADGARWDAENLGHRARTVVRLGRHRGVMIGGELYDVVRPVEEWHLAEDEVGLATFFLHRDFRDYFGAHGGALLGGLFIGPDADLTVRYADERWRSRRARDPISLFRNAEPWRDNPAADEGAFHLVNATLRVDTRNVVDRPWSGWYVVADYEHGTGRATSLAPLPAAVRPGADADVSYGRGFLDVRRYNRISPTAQVNLRAVLGGWLHGGPLPAQRRLSVGGPGTLPGFDFRSLSGAADVSQCTAGTPLAGLPAQCDRVALVQAEYRSDLRFTLGLGEGLELRHQRMRRSEWVAFVNTGRGWLVGAPPAGTDAAELWTRRGRLPGLGTFRTDVGIGVDLGLLGIYVAKAVSESGQPANLYVRLSERF